MNQQSNAIYMVAIDHGKSNWKHSNFAQYSRKSWERWCEKNGVDFFCVTEHDDRYGYPIWNKLNVIDVCKVFSAASVCWVIPAVVSFHPYRLRINPKISGETAFATF